MQQLRPDVDAESVGAEHMRVRRGLQDVHEVLRGRAVVSEQRCGHGHAHDHGEHAAAGDERAAAIPAGAEAVAARLLAELDAGRRRRAQATVHVGHAQSNRTLGSISE